MLVLTRAMHEGVDIGPDIRVTVIKIRGGHVRLGFEAPPDVKILRTELENGGNQQRQERQERKE